MDFDLKDAVVLRTLPRRIEAGCFNRVHLALLRVSNPLYIELPKLRLEFILTKKLWVAYSLIHRLPMLAWTDFKLAERGLHESVPCQMHLYHVHAGLLISTSLDALDTFLKEYMNGSPDKPA